MAKCMYEWFVSQDAVATPDSMGNDGCGTSPLDFAEKAMAMSTRRGHHFLLISFVPDAWFLGCQELPSVELHALWRGLLFRR